VLATPEELNGAPAGFNTLPIKGSKELSQYQYRMQVRLLPFFMFWNAQAPEAGCILTMAYIMLAQSTVLCLLVWLLADVCKCGPWWWCSRCRCLLRTAQAVSCASTCALMML
jgi:hypothetical protein